MAMIGFGLVRQTISRHIFQGCLLQILLCPFLNTLHVSHQFKILQLDTLLNSVSLRHYFCQNFQSRMVYHKGRSIHFQDHYQCHLKRFINLNQSGSYFLSSADPFFQPTFFLFFSVFFSLKLGSSRAIWISFRTDSNTSCVELFFRAFFSSVTIKLFTGIAKILEQSLVSSGFQLLPSIFDFFFW